MRMGNAAERVGRIGNHMSTYYSYFTADVKTCPDAAVGRIFFFQAEDGIRDVAVTGVQTCALPILLRPCKLGDVPNGDPTGYVTEFAGTQHVVYRGKDQHVHELWGGAAGWQENILKIGRASCRERV